MTSSPNADNIMPRRDCEQTYIENWKFNMAIKNMADSKARMLGDKPVDLTKFSTAAREAIKLGEVKPGMTRAEVLVARGYPPEQSTISLDSDAWKYQQSKWNAVIVHFDGNKVIDIKD